MKFFGKNKNGQTGSNVILLVVVILNLTLLAGIIIPRLIATVDEQPAGKAKIQMDILTSALKNYKKDNGNYPSTEQGLKALVEQPAIGNIPKNWRQGGYLEKGTELKDPWGNDFIYSSPGAHGDFDLTSLGADGVAGGEGANKDINNWDSK